MSRALLQQALDALEYPLGIDEQNRSIADAAITAIRAALDAPQPEPAAWMHHYRQVPSGGAYQQADIGEMGPYPKDGYRWVFGAPLYTAPPKETT